jgi:2-phosphosulfolactate phosphatase
VKLFLYHTPEQTPVDALPDCAIAIDVLRATTTIAKALAVGAEAVQVFSSIETLFEVSDAWPADKRLRAGERGGAMVEGCDLGNSPLDCTPELFTDRRLFLSTTNGTRTLQRIQDSPLVMTAALVNRKPVVDKLIKHKPETVWIVGSGWEGSYALEDTVCGGAIMAGVMAGLGLSIADVAGNDEAVAALALFEHWETKLDQLLLLATHGQRLDRLKCHEDLAYCATLDCLDVLPLQSEAGVLKAG